jgi:IclR family pca regulon transcriptional regulator
MKSNKRGNSKRGGKAQDGSPDREFVQALERGLAVIRAFSAETPAMTIADVAERTSLTRAAARRYLRTLQQLGCLRQIDSRFTLTPRVLDLGFAYLSSMTQQRLVEPYMEELVASLHESCSLSVLDGPDIVYVARVPAKRIMSINLVVGSRLPAHATSMGKILLAHLTPQELDHYFSSFPRSPLTRRTICDETLLRKALAEVRQRGWAFADQESEDGVRSVATSVTDGAGQVRLAMNVSVHATRVSLEELRRTHLPLLLATAREVSDALRVSGPQSRWVSHPTANPPRTRLDRPAL